MYSDIQYLSVPLPEDVLKLKYFGDVERLQRVIDLKLQKELPLPLRKRLELEKQIMARWVREYPYTQAEALDKLRVLMGGFEEAELEQLRDQDAVEWAYINGEVCYKNNFLSNLIKVRPQYAARVLPEKQTPDNGEDALLDAAVAQMKDAGDMAVRFHMHTTMTVDELPGRENQTVKAHLPLPIDYAQVKNIQILQVSEHPHTIAPADYPQRTICFEAVPQADKPFMVDYTYETHMQYQAPVAEGVLDAQPTFYTQEQAPHIVFTPYLRMLAKEVVGEEQNPLLKARKIYDYITKHVTYSYMRDYVTLPNIPEYAATSLKGDCGVQALLFITLCRIVGVPARWQSGLYVTPFHVGSHDWAQFYVAPYGWLFADPSFGGGALRHQKIERWNFYFGNLDPYRLPANSEFQHNLYVPCRYLRDDPYDNQQGEAEYADAAVDTRSFHTRQRLVEMFKIGD